MLEEQLRQSVKSYELRLESSLEEQITTFKEEMAK
jgi:hypothetical protein